MLFLGPSTKGTFCMCFFQGNWKSLNSLQIPFKLSSWRELFRCFIGLFWILCSKSLYLTWMLSIGDSTTLYSFSHLHVEMWDFLRSSCLLLSKVLKRHPWACWKFLFPGMQIWVLIGSFFFFFFFKSLLNLLQYCFCFMFCFFFIVARHVGSWLPNQGSNLHPLHWKAMNHQGNPLICSWRRREKKMADDLLMGKHRRMKGTIQVIESDLLLFCVSPSLPLLWLPQWVHLCFSCCWGLRLYSRGAGMTELRCRIKEIRNGGLGRV